MISQILREYSGLLESTDSCLRQYSPENSPFNLLLLIKFGLTYSLAWRFPFTALTWSEKCFIWRSRSASVWTYLIQLRKTRPDINPSCIRFLCYFRDLKSAHLERFENCKGQTPWMDIRWKVPTLSKNRILPSPRFWKGIKHTFSTLLCSCFNGIYFHAWLTWLCQ